MKLPGFLTRRIHWLNLPGAILMLVLQRLPALNLAVAADEMVVSTPIGVVLKSVVAAVAALGAVNSMAGATPLVPSSGTASGATVNSGTAVSIFFTVNGTQTPIRSWTVAGAVPPGLNFSGLTSADTVNVATLQLAGVPTTGGVFNVTLTAFDGFNATGFESAPYGYTITVNGGAVNTAPAITTQPVNQTVTVGANVTFTAAANGTPAPTFQWKKDNVNIGGATNASLNIPSAAAGDAGAYTVVATNSAGTATSNAATLTVNPVTNAPVITTQPASQSVTVGANVTFTAAANGTPAPAFQWKKDNVSIGGATNASLNIPSAAAGDAGAYTVTATNAAGSATSNAATLTVAAAPVAPAIITQPGTQTVTVGNSVKFTVAASGTPTPALQWKKGGANIAGATGATFTIVSVAAGDAGAYTVTATNAAGSATSDAATLGVLASRLIDETVTTGHSVRFSGANASGSIQWQVSSDGGTTWTNLAEGGNYHGTTSNTLAVTDAGAALNGLKFRYVATDNGSVSTSPAVTIAVAAALVPFPASIAVDAAGNLYVGDGTANTVQKINPAGQVSLVAGSNGTAGSADGAGAAARFNGPNGAVLLANGSLVVVDTANSTLRTVTPAGDVTTLAGTAGTRGNADGGAAAATFSSPAAVARTAGGVLFVADAMNHTVRKITSDGIVATFAGNAGVTGSANGTGGAARFNLPSGVAVGSGDTVYVADTNNNLIRKITTAGDVSTLAGVQGVSGFDDGTGAAALFNRPEGMAADVAGNIYLADTDNSTIRKITAAGAVETIAGLPSVAGLEDGPGIFALFNHPQALIVDAAGNIYVADTGNAAIRKIDAAGNVSTLALSSAPAPAPTPTPTPPPTPAPTPTPTPSPSGGGGGGGGACSPWFLAALSLLGFARRLRQPRT